MKRVLHLVGALVQGGIETWLMHVLRNTDRQQYQMDFLVWGTEGAYEAEALALGSHIYRGPNRHKMFDYMKRLRQVLREHGPYDVVHCHLHHSSGFILRVAAQEGVPVRIAHSHNDRAEEYANASLPKRMFLKQMKRWVDRYATVGLGCSGLAAASLFGPNWSSNPICRVLYYGVDMSAFQTPAGNTLRAELGLEPHHFVVGHVGRFFEQKNHPFIVDIAAELTERCPEARFLLVGDGPLRPAIEARVAEKKLVDRVLFTGLRSDVSRLMMQSMDAFLMPSFHEGLPMVMIESQAAGLPCFISEVISDESDIVPALIHRLSLKQPPAVWAEALLKGRHASLEQPQALEIVENSPFNICRSVKTLESIYVK